MIRLFQKYRFLFMLLLLLSSCGRKDVPPSLIGDPVFTLQAQIGGNDIDLQAGNDDYYMFTSFGLDTCEQVILTGRLAKVDSCNQACLEAFQIDLVHQPLSTGAGFSIEEALSTEKNYQVLEVENSADRFLTRFIAFTQGSSPFTYNWNFGDGAVSSLPNPQHEYQTPGENFTVSLTTIDAEDCQQTYQREILVDTVSTNDFCRAEFSVDSLISATSNGYLLNALTTGNPPFTYLWSSGNLTAQDTVFLDSFVTKTVCLTITDVTGCVDSICKDLTLNPVLGDVEVCSTRFEHEVSIEPGMQVPCPAGFVFSYTDPAGRLYRSDLGPPATADFVDLVAVNDFEDNENGEATKQVRLLFSATLYDESGNDLSVQNGLAVFGMAYPE
ncbi:MAG: PKD domain-containing protein [Bacteroidota bacterium]